MVSVFGTLYREHFQNAQQTSFMNWDTYSQSTYILPMEHQVEPLVPLEQIIISGQSLSFFSWRSVIRGG